MGRNGRRFEISRARIDRIARRIASRFRPEKVILFGSWARGDADRDSDIDLLVVLPVSGSRHRKRAEMLVALHDFPVPIDIVLATPEEAARAPTIPGSVVRSALEEGNLLYARSE